VKVATDRLIVDLEDAVAPGDKDRARAIVVDTLQSRACGLPTVVRINSLGSRAALADLTALLERGPFPDALLIPKVESPTHIEIVDGLLHEAGAHTMIVALIESACGIEAVYETLRVGRRLIAAMTKLNNCET